MSEVRLIDANAYAAEMKVRQDACKELMDAAKQYENWEVYDRMNTAFGIFVEAKLTLDNMPTVDAVPVVRCLECEHRFTSGCPMRFDYAPVNNGWFCADGERR
ncbi:MAG: hypothetical protein IIY75_05230 [Erysipelotrichales bacterium]|nr:hypothetical protein [Erysipelotrichales bacterium]